LNKLSRLRLWNQVAEQTHLLVYDTQFTSVVDLKEFYDNFIHEFQHRINVLKLVEIIIPVANHLFDKGILVKLAITYLLPSTKVHLS
jgi:hypothetical protein